MIRATKALLLATVAVAAFSSAPASAADIPVYRAPPPVVDVWNPWMIRIRAVGVLPRDSGTVDIPSVPIAHPVPGDVPAVSKTVIPEIDISYFFTPNIALELILGVTPHKVTGQGVLSGLDIGQTWLLPPTLTLQYHFTYFGAFKPYIGGGVNYTVFFNTSGSNAPAVVPLTAPLGASLTVTDLNVKNAFAPAAQIGFDYMLTKNVGVNVDVKKLWLRPDWSGAISVGGGAPLPSLGKVNLDPWLVGGGLTYKF
ncbi:MAG: OmpW/AlkL family protein [Rhodoplanes sp.]